MRAAQEFFHGIGDGLRGANMRQVPLRINNGSFAVGDLVIQIGGNLHGYKDMVQ